MTARKRRALTRAGGWLGLLVGVSASVAAPVAFGASAVAPPVDITAPSTLTAPILITFASPTSGVTTQRVMLRHVGGSLVPTRIACRDTYRRSVNCAAGPVATATVSPRAPLAPGGGYVATVTLPGSAPASWVFTAAPAAEETSPAVTHTSGWVETRLPGASGLRVLQASRPGATLRFVFAGSAVSVALAHGPRYGRVKVIVDNHQRGSVTLRASRRALVVTRIAGLRAATHTLTLRVAVGVVAVDRFEASGPPPAGIAPTDEVIQHALAEHRITQTQAVLYEAALLTGAGGIPPVLVGAPTGDDDAVALADIEAHYRSLPAAARRVVGRVFEPPTTRASRFNASVAARAAPAAATPSPGGAQWGVVSSSRVRVWYEESRPGGAAQARSVLNELVGTIWPKETSLMQTTPISDGGVSEPHGGDERFDVYLADCSGCAIGLTLPYDGTCNTGPRFIVINADAADEAVVSHEFFHALVAAYPQLNCGADAWWDEATATWASTYVYGLTGHSGEKFRSDAEKYQQANALYGYPRPLDNSSDGGYSRTLFAAYLAREFGPDVIRQTWAQAGSQIADNAIDAALAPDGGLAQVLPAFALQIADVPPYNTLQTELGLPEETAGGFSTSVDDDDLRLDDLWSSSWALPRLSIQFGYFTYNGGEYGSFPTSTRSTAFFNAWAANGRTPPTGLTVQGLVKINGSWSVEDWTQLESRFYCRQQTSERVQEMIVVITNASTAKLPALPDDEQPEVGGNDSPCLGFSGTISGSRASTSASTGMSFSDAWHASAHFTRSETTVINGQTLSFFTLDPTTLHYAGMSGSSTDGCTDSVPATDFSLDSTQGQIATANVEPTWAQELKPPSYQGGDPYQEEDFGGIDYTQSCPEGPIPANWPFDTIWFSTADPQHMTSTPLSGTELNGKYTYHDAANEANTPDNTTTINWSLVADPNQ